MTSIKKKKGQEICDESVINEIEVTMKSSVISPQIGESIELDILHSDSFEPLVENTNDRTKQATMPLVQTVKEVMKRTKIPHTSVQELDFGVGCSHWKTIDDVNNETDLKLRLRKVKEIHEEKLSSDSMLSEVDDTDADPDFSCFDNETKCRGPRLINDSSEDELFVPRRVDIPENWQRNNDHPTSSDSEAEPPQIKLENGENRKGKKNDQPLHYGQETRKHFVEIKEKFICQILRILRKLQADK